MKRIINKILVGLLCLIIANSEGSSQQKILLKSNGQEFVHKKRDHHDNGNTNCEESPYRSIDGLCNNLKNEEWGASDIALFRAMDSEYGSSDYYSAMGGESRLSARAISNALCVETEVSLSQMNLSSFVFTWGQFLDHDISLTPEAHEEYEPISLPSDEQLFTEDIPFFRSERYENTGVNNYRQQSNLITSWIDGSNVYGSDKERADWLRSNVDGKLKVSKGMLLPYNTIDGEIESELDPNAPSMAGDGSGTNKVFVAGDIRANEQPGLTALHTLFVRLHNKICDELKKKGQRDDEELYLNARKRVAGIIQSITYNEFLPALGIRLRGKRGYDERIQADVSNLFATAAYRLGHTMVTEQLLLLDNNCMPTGSEDVSLIDGFFNPDIIKENNIAPVLKGLVCQTQNEVDLKITDNLRNFLFGDPSSGMAFGLDLASLNIQRGRDHGLANYNEVRKRYTGRAAHNFSDITKDRNVQKKLETLYRSINEIDLWVGLLAEDKLKNASVGPTLHNILKAQFESLRDGDRFYYRFDKTLKREEREKIDRVRLSELILQNTSLTNLPRNVFFADKCGQGIEQSISKRSVEGIKEIGVTIFPNPASDQLYLSFGEQLEEYRNKDIYITDVQNRTLTKMVVDRARIEVDLGQFAPGNYFVKVGDKEKYKILRFIKVK